MAWIFCLEPILNCASKERCLSKLDSHIRYTLQRGIFCRIPSLSQLSNLNKPQKSCPAAQAFCHWSLGFICSTLKTRDKWPFNSSTFSESFAHARVYRSNNRTELVYSVALLVGPFHYFFPTCPSGNSINEPQTSTEISLHQGSRQ